MTGNFNNNNPQGKKGFGDLKPVHKAVCIALVAAAALISICLLSSGMGVVGGIVRTVLRGLFSWGSLIIPVAIIAQVASYAEDLDGKRFVKRSIFALVSTLLFSSIEYAISVWNSAMVFSPIDAFTNMNGGGLVGNTVGYLLCCAFSPVGAIIVSVMVLAIYPVFFFAEKAGSLGQAAINFVAGIKRIVDFIKEKNKNYREKKKQIKEDADQHRREVSSEELIDDEFFKAKGDASEVKIKKLGIEENASTNGLSPLVDPEKRIVEEPAVVVEPEPEVKRKRVDKPLDLSYGIDAETVPEKEPEQIVTKPASDKLTFGLDDRADNVFTQNFNPFDFATSEKKAAKYASMVSGGSDVTEELDDMTIYQMKADHEPDAKEKRMMELERKKKDWEKRKQANQPTSPVAPKQAQPTPTPISQIHTQPAPTPMAAPNPAPAVTPTQPVAVNIPTPTPTRASTPAPGYSRPASPASSPIKTVEFTVSKSPNPVAPSPVESAPVSMKVEKPAATEKSAEDVAKLISQRVAAENPAYIRSANDMKTFTKIVADEDDELYRQLEGIPTEPVGEVAPQQSAAESSSVDSATEEPTLEFVGAEPTIEFIGTEPEIEFIGSEPAIEFVGTEPEISFASTELSAVDTATDTETIVVPDINVAVAPATPVAAPVAAPVAPAPEFKPYTPPVIVPVTPPTSDENVLKAERSMLPPTPEAIAEEAAKEPEVVTPPTKAEGKPEETEIDFIPVDESLPEDTSSHTPDTDETEPLFIPVNEDEAESETEEDEDTVEINFDDEDDDDDSDGDDDDDGDDDGDDDDDDDDDDEGEESGDDIVEGEIPPEEQNPDVAELRKMFPFLAPLGDQPATEEKKPEEAKAEEVTEETAPAEAPKSDASADVPFDGAVKVKTEPAPTAIVPVNEKREKKSDKPDYSDYKFPSLDFLASGEDDTDENTQAEIQENADKLIETLASFGVTASIKGVDRGPRITRYEVVPAKGVKVSSILNLQDDIALNLAAGSIRMEAPIPGKSAVGIEIPNKKSSIVRLRNLLETPDFESNKSKTFVCIGRDVAGQPVFGDLAKMPHLLIAGATGMGKSVCINALLISILYKARPDEVKLIMIDPKQVEFTMYNGIPHLLVPVVSDPKQAAGALMWAVEEMERRYNLLNPLCVRNIEAYNEKVAADPSLGDPMSKIIIVIDEFADLMLQVKDPVEQLVTRIAQKARAAGIHLVIGTQRPSVNVITGVIKANVPSRISCKVMSNVDSKTVLDSAGAEKLLDKGDALYAPAGSAKPHRLQCAFVADGEVEAIMNYLKQYTDGEAYDSTVMEDIERAAQRCSKKGGERDDGDSSDISGEGYLNDRQFLDAVEIAVNTRKISTSLIQRKLSIGYGKAAKFIDIMEDMGIVGEANGQRPREVKLTPDEWREKLARSSY